MLWIDSHTHHQFSNYTTLLELRRLGCYGVAVLSYMPVKPTYHVSLIDLYRWLLDEEYKRITSVGLRAIIGLGIHPRNIPSDWREALNYMEEALAAYSYAILGEVGLELGSNFEVEVLREQLRIAEKSDRPIVLHSPRRNKLVIVKKLLNILEDSGLSEDLVIIDHLNKEVLDELSSNIARYGIGLTIQEGKLTGVDALEILKNHEDLVESIVLNSDCGREPSEPFAVYNCVNYLLNEGLKEDLVEKIAYVNAKRMLNL